MSFPVSSLALNDREKLANIHDLSHIQNVVFAGGGNRCFWQAGFWDAVAEELNLAPKQFVSVSAGSAISCSIIAGRLKETLHIVKIAASKTPYNHRWQNIFEGKPVFPHAPIYRKIIIDVLQGDGLKKLLNGPENRIEIARIPKWLGPRTATVVGLGAYQIEKHWKKPVHPKAGRALGFTSEFISSHECGSITEIADAILASSCTPPFTPLMYRQKRAALDGGLVDNVPVHGIPDQQQGDTLVLLSRPYQHLPSIPGRIYVQPSKKVPVKGWDYTNPIGIQETFDQGRKDGEQFLAWFTKN